jgi:hypothetical protein
MILCFQGTEEETNNQNYMYCNCSIQVIPTDRDIYNKDINREDIVARVKALGISFKKKSLLTSKNYSFHK